MRGSALARGCGRGGRVVLPLARAAAVSAGLRVLVRRKKTISEGRCDLAATSAGEGPKEESRASWKKMGG